jgi:prepilin-type N-terminal cleavage/methylation domain-containing protein/prepilin-type processing-associated H-X9-DG protein
MRIMATTPTTRRHGEKSNARSVAGFSLIELLVVVAVISIMAALLLPALSKSKEQARGAVCRSNMKQLALAFLMYAEDNEETFPWPGGQPGRAAASPDQYSPDWCGGTNFSDMEFTVASIGLPGFGHNAECGSVFPYVTSQPRREYDPNYKEITPVYRCPSTGKLGEGLRVNYSANAYMDPGKPFGDFDKVPPKGLMTTAVTDASRKVLLLNEDPDEMKTTAFLPSSVSRKVTLHLDRANIAFMDGHMESVSSSDFFKMRTASFVSVYFKAGK